MKKLRKGLGIFLSLALVLQTMTMGVFALGTSVKDDENSTPYKNMAIFGDSICLGFSTEAASMNDSSTYDIERNILRAAQGEDYSHCYPTQLAKRMGIDTLNDIDYSAGEKWDYTLETEWDDVYNLGVCAAWSSDILELLRNPYYVYSYASANYDKDSTWILPHDYVDPYTGEVTKAGTEVPVVQTTEYAGYEYEYMNPMISSGYIENDVQYSYQHVGRNALEKGITQYYPAEWQYDGMYTYTLVPVASEENIAEYGEPVANPEFTKFYYDFANKVVDESELIMLALGNNDIYHSFMPYQQGSGTMLGTLVYLLSYALQMNMSVGDILTMLSDPSMLEYLFGGLMSENGSNTLELLDGQVKVELSDDGETADVDLGSLISLEEIQKLLEYYSSENVTAYLKDVVKNYKNNYREIITYIGDKKEAQNEPYEIALVSHYNPFGIVNYIQLIANSLENGKLFERLEGDAEIVQRILELIIGDSEYWAEYEGLSEEEIMIKAQEDSEEAEEELGDILEEIQKFLKEGDNDKLLTQLITDMSFPLAVIVVGNSLQDTYDDMNSFLEELNDAGNYMGYNVDFIDISNAPSSGRYDPHPTVEGHTWIADTIYEQIVSEIECESISDEGGSGHVSGLGTQQVGLHKNCTYKFKADEGSNVEAIYIDGKKLSKEAYLNIYKAGEYTFKNVTEDHTFAVEFAEGEDEFAHNVTVLANNAYSAGDGKYYPGETVTVYAGYIEKYDFKAWNPSSASVQPAKTIEYSFVMPDEDVIMVAEWTIKGSGGGGGGSGGGGSGGGGSAVTSKYSLTFETNGGTAIDTLNLSKGTVVDLDKYTTTKTGYSFDGWYSDSKLTNRINEVTLNANTKVYAKWNKKYFSKDGTYNGYIDVDESLWYGTQQQGVIRDVTLLGLMSGDGNGYFRPTEDIKVSEVIKIAAVTNNKYYGNATTFKAVSGNDWYKEYVEYAINKGIIGASDFDSYDRPATRSEMAYVFANAVPDTYLPQITTRMAPDIDSDKYKVQIAKLFKAGVLIGNDALATFEGSRNITRAEAAAIITRIALPDTRIR